VATSSGPVVGGDHHLRAVAGLVDADDLGVFDTGLALGPRNDLVVRRLALPGGQLTGVDHGQHGGLAAGAERLGHQVRRLARRGVGGRGAVRRGGQVQVLDRHRQRTERDHDDRDDGSRLAADRPGPAPLLRIRPSASRFGA
jgi:hypothetical protein